MKNFEKWLQLKPRVDKFREEVTLNEREVWWVYLGTNVGDEEDGKNDLIERPVLILKKFSKKLFIGLPLSTKIKDGVFYFTIKSEKNSFSVLLSQIRILSSKRLIRKEKHKVSRGNFKNIKDKLKVLLKL